MTELKREIKGYHILGWTQVRGEGSLYGDHPNRCLWPICGKPMIQWSMEAAKNSKYLDKIAVTTESEEIKEIVKGLGGITVIDRPLWTSYNMPRDYTKGEFKRNKPRSLLSKEAPIYNGTYEYLAYCLKKTENYEAEIHIHIAAIAPMITGEIIDRLIEKFFQDEEAGIAFTLYPIPPGVLIINPVTGRPLPLITQLGRNKQKRIPLYQQAGLSLMGSPSRLNDIPIFGSTNFIEILFEEGLDVHNKEDLFLANCYMKRRLLKEKKEVRWEIGQDDKHKNKKKEI